MSSVRGAGILIWGRHELYVSSLAALLTDLGARAQVLDPSRPLPERAPPGAELLLLECPLPTELRRGVALGLPVVVVVERGGAEQEHAAAQLGAGALVEKGATLRELGEAIERARRTSARLPAGSAENLTPRQREVLELIVEGLDNRQIAARLGVTERTARAHTSGVLKRLGEPNRTRAAVAALRRGLLSCLALGVAFAILAGTATARTPSTASPSALGRVVSAQMRAAGAGSGAWVLDTGSGRVISAVRSEKRRAPASVQKLLTAATALDQLGPDYRFETQVLAAAQPAEGILAGDLYLRGSGDPSLAETGLTQLARTVGKPGPRGASKVACAATTRCSTDAAGSRAAATRSRVGWGRYRPCHSTTGPRGPWRAAFSLTLRCLRRADWTCASSARASTSLGRHAPAGRLKAQCRSPRSPPGRWPRWCATWDRFPTTSMPRP